MDNHARILIVDDEPDIIAVMKLTVELKGFSVVTAYDGEEGLRRAKETKPDLIILDVLMPKAFGDDIATRLREDPETMSIPIIFLTNLPPPILTGETEGDIEFQRDTHGNLYLQKTCSEDQLFFAINQLLNKKV